MILWILGLSVASGLLYYAGGQVNKLFRRLGCNAMALGLFVALRGAEGLKMAYILPYALTFGLSVLALGTYWDFLTRLWRGDEDEYFENWLLTGIGYGLAAIPLLWCDVVLWAIIGRAVFLAISITLLRTRTGNVFKEEFFSGLLYCGSIWILLI